MALCQSNGVFNKLVPVYNPSSPTLLMREGFFVCDFFHWVGLDEVHQDRRHLKTLSKHYKIKSKSLPFPYKNLVQLAADDVAFGFGNKIPLWMFGFLY